MKVNIYSIAKKQRDHYSVIEDELMAMSKKFATVESIEIMNKKIVKAHKIFDEAGAKQSYSEAYEQYKKNGYNIVLDNNAKLMDSFEFSKLFSDKLTLNFFIGGAYGFEESFIRSCDKKVSLSPLTMTHKVAKVVLLEQVYRALTIVNGHPYHK
jgi:23S rRNA (pseudouridine1915-N3)-methyltransferase